MMHRGVIIDVKKDYSIVLSEGEFCRIQNKSNMIEGMNVLFTKEDKIIKDKKDKRVIPIFRYASIAASLVLVLMMSLVYYNNQIAVFTIVTMDINPSVEVLLNSQNEVIVVKALNEDGKSLLDVDVDGLVIDEAIALLVEEAKDDGYIKNDHDAFIVVTAVAIKDKDDGDHVKEIEALIETSVDETKLLREVTVAILQANEEELEEAKSTNVPLPLVALKNKGKAQNAKSVKEVYGDPELLQEMAEEGKVLGNSLQNRNDIQVIVDKLVELGVDESEFMDSAESLNDLSKEELKELKNKGKELLAEAKQKGNKEDRAEDEDKDKDEDKDEDKDKDKDVEEQSEDEAEDEESDIEKKDKDLVKTNNGNGQDKSNNGNSKQ